MIKVGLTGGIGAGKSWIAKIFQNLGVPIYNADLRSKEILFNSEIVHTEIKNKIGENVFTNGIPDRKKLADIVFNDQEKLAILNSILHPKVKEDYEKWLVENATAPYTIKEAAILFETGIYKFSDKNILVTAPKSIRIERVKKRDNTSQEEIESRMNKQWDDEKKIPLADLVIVNDGKQAILSKILDFHERLINQLEEK